VPHYASTLDLELPISYQLFLVQGPMARHVRDLRLALSAMSGGDARDPWSVPAPFRGNRMSDRVGSLFERDRRRPLHVALTIDPAGLGVDATIAEGVRKAARALSDAGCVVEEVDPPAVSEAHDLWGALLAAESRVLVLPLLGQLLSEEASTIFNYLVESFPGSDLAVYVEGLARRNRVARDWALFLDRYDVILGPVSCAAPFKVGADLASQEAFAQILLDMRLVTAVNLLGLPAAVVPVGIAKGLPQAAQIIAGRYREDLCLAAAEAIENRLGVITPIDPCA
jgi:amidase